MEERLYWLGFSVFPGIGPTKFHTLLTRFNTAKNAWNASVNDLIPIIGQVLSIKFDLFRQSFLIHEYEKKLQDKKISFLAQNEKEYPQLLKEIANPPIILFVKGSYNFNEGNQKVIAVVGTRRITRYGEEVTAFLTQQLVDAGFIVASGLAMGVDAVAHKTTIDAGGKTLAVLGCGIDCCRPSINQSLYNAIAQRSGCIVSELPLSHPPTKGSFPSRNRIIAGLSHGVIVTEGAEDSGALITAEYAFTFHRPVFAVPGPITSSLSKGPYKLLEKGGKLVTSLKDITETLGIKNTQINTGKEIKGETSEEQQIIHILHNESLSFDEIVRKTNLSSSQIGSLLSIMEIKGFIKSLANGEFCIVN